MSEEDTDPVYAAEEDSTRIIEIPDQDSQIGMKNLSSQNFEKAVVSTS